MDSFISGYEAFTDSFSIIELFTGSFCFIELFKEIVIIPDSSFLLWYGGTY